MEFESDKGRRSAIIGPICYLIYVYSATLFSFSNIFSGTPGGILFHHICEIISLVRLKLAVWVEITNRIGDSPNLLLNFAKFYRLYNILVLRQTAGSFRLANLLYDMRTETSSHQPPIFNTYPYFNLHNHTPLLIKVNS